MTVDMVFAETMVSDAAGAIPEFQLRVFGIRPAAYGAFVNIRKGLRIPLRLLCRPAEFRAMAEEPAKQGLYPVIKLIPAKEEIIQDADQRKQRTAADHDIEIEDGFRIGQPGYLYGNDEEEKDPVFRPKGGENEKHAQVEVGGIRHDIPTENEPYEKGIENDKSHSQQIIYGKLTLAPCLLQQSSDEVLKVQHQYQTEDTAGAGDENKTDEPPDFSVQDPVSGENQIIYQGRAPVHHGQQIDQRVPDDDIEHQVSDPKIGVLPKKTVDPILEALQQLHDDLLFSYRWVILILQELNGNVYERIVNFPGEERNARP
jgi:hypothetical protein